MTMMVKFWGGIGNNGQSAGTGDWSTASNWLPNQVPGIGDLAIDQGGHIVATNVGIEDMTVWLDSTGSVPVELSLDGSTLGPATDLITNSTIVPNTIELQNSPLEGSIFAGSGQTQMTVDPNSSAVNYGWIGVANTITPTGITLQAQGAFGNEGLVEAGTNGSFTLVYGAGSGGMQNVWNTGDLRADPGGRVWLDANRATTTTGAHFTGTLLNLGVVTANGGNVELDTAVVQAPSGALNVTNGGTMTLQGALDGGTVSIASGMLAFGGDNSSGPGPFAAAHFGGTLALTGDSATLDFGQTVSAVDFDPTQNRLEVAFPWQGGSVYGAYLNLSGSYTANDFAVSGHQVLYTAHPTT